MHTGGSVALESPTGKGVAGYNAWSELLTAIEARRRLADTERRRLEAMQQTITAERAMLRVAALVDVVRRDVDDRRVLAAIGEELGKVYGGR